MLSVPYSSLVVLSILLLCSDTLKRPHPPDYLDRTKRLKTDDTFSEYLFLLATTCPRSQFTSSFGSDDVSAGLTSLWNSAWGQNPDVLFETRSVDRDGTLPDVHTPRTCMVLNVPRNILKKFFISSILVRQEYVIALKFAIFIARGGRPSQFKHHKNASYTLEVDEPLPDSENESSPDPTMQLNPFISTDPPDPDQAGAVTYLGHPGIGM